MRIFSKKVPQKQLCFGDKNIGQVILEGAGNPNIKSTDIFPAKKKSVEN